MRQIIFTITFAVCATLAFGQQELMVSQYMFNGVFINPGYAGSHKYWEATALHRTQWVNLDGAPQSQMIAVDGPLMG